ncbi:DUF3221 domain-containing protein [Halobacillus sp. Nhm2S1]|uniref:DUF3221 domain-containing protein n=1 Tax=Halobacillus sp. Nhm2S1 TaxID=2866716 RepID=UPI001C736A7A|nr:DUF3221 domain-containing protein [Halobacillus sp. Nhm2S1]MBX0356802.1 YobA family protein [Halobacillus sp. Nhm2S1]
MSVEDDYILVVAGITETQAENKNWNGFSQKEKSKYHPFSFKPSGFFDDFSGLKKGDRVKVWAVEGASESYPAQSEVGKIEKVE